MKKKLIFLLTLALTVCNLSTTAFADKKETESKVTNSNEMGIIDISLTNSYIDEEGNMLFVNGPREIMPGMKLSLIPEITNNGHDSYIRAKLSIVVKQDDKVLETPFPISLEDVYGINEDLKVVGDYLYGTEVFEHGDTLQIFEGIKIPADLSQDFSGAEVEVSILVDAVQSDYFELDFAKDDPWKGLDVLKNEKEFDFATFRTSSKVSIQVVYEGVAQGIVIMPDDFFAHFESMLPGGTYSDVITLENSAENPTEIFFKTGVIERNKKLLEKIQVEIKSTVSGSEKVIYTGPYNSESLQEYVSLGTLASGGKGEMTFTITIPEELDNEFTLETGSIEWYFKAVEDIPNPTPAPTNPPGGSIIDKVTNAVKTGDEAPIITFTVMAVVASGVLVVLATKKRRREE